MLTPSPARRDGRAPGRRAEAVEQRVEGTADLGPHRLGSSARATSIAASSSAPIKTWASGRTGCARDRPRLDRRPQGRLDQAEAVRGGDLAPAIPAQHRRPVEQDDPLRLRLGAGREEHLRAGPHRLQRRGRVGRQGARGDPLGQLDLDPLVDRLEELALAVEVVVEGAAGDAGGAHDLLGADPA